VIGRIGDWLASLRQTDVPPWERELRSVLAEHGAGEHEVIRHQACPVCHALNPPPSEVVVGRLRWDPSAGPLVRATGRPAGGLVYDPEPPDDSGDWIQVETATGLVWRRLSGRLAGRALPADGDDLDRRARNGDR
jgi:hypothetical protein